ncbi:ApaG protein [Breoghania corrubedonensis]|uniref:Protein ApaG n=1 Tax=Breoghania corrubedonensis TaxID=665038 RepID=A0A2T5VEE5_9HYPH|nr:Co2+/Mg2+ efflux protein ApaG [Breoghania corrubedonensis]PTW62130.1 ApaG protein [Breoghania corrubedonensis]
MYSEETRGIEVVVEPTYLADQSAPSDDHYFWAYTVRIVNQSDDTVQLLSRHWKITDASGRVQEVRGAGVVGEQPVLRPGASYQYTSGCPLATTSGIMVGSYQMQTRDGDVFAVAIPAFPLDIPDLPRVLN